VIDAAIGAGAHGCYLSGAGSTVLALTSGRLGDVYAQVACLQAIVAVAAIALIPVCLLCSPNPNATMLLSQRQCGQQQKGSELLAGYTSHPRQTVAPTL
jgi:hypothetical protein